LDYTFNPRWGLSLTVPYADRDHSHLHHHHGAVLKESWDIRGVGDIRALGRYALESQPASLLFGFKLPTGETDEDNAAGDPAERSLQPGSGTTDLLLGVAYRGGAPTSPWSWFSQAMYQRALAEHDGFRPGYRVSLDLGLRFAASDALSLLLQLNGLVTGRDHGSEAEPESSGGEFLFLSPGLSYALTSQLQVYGFVQQAVYQRVNGVQLTADRGYLLGVSAHF
jgi:hypothetical protein